MNALVEQESVATYGFGQVEVQAQRRELRVGGKAVPVEPLIFDLLIYLIEHRSRVVSTGELLTEVWGTVHVSDTVLPRAIMKLRRALGDDNRDGMVRTVNKVGYRFTAEVNEAGQAKPQSPASAVNDGQVRLALLPFRNETGDDALAWIEYGLPSVVVSNLAAEPQLQVLSVADTIIAVAAAGARAPLSRRLVALENVMGCQNAVDIQVSRQSGGFAAEWCTAGPAAPNVSGKIEAPTVTDAALLVAPALLKIYTRSSAEPPQGPFALGDNFLNVAYARAMQAVEEQRPRDVIALLELCMTVERRPMEVDFHMMTALGRCQDARAPVMAQRLLKRCAETGDKGMEARTLCELAYQAHSCLQLHTARDYADRALSLADELANERIGMRARLYQAMISMGNIDLPLASQQAKSALALAEKTVNRKVESFALALMGEVERWRGEVETAMVCLQKSIDLAQRLHRPMDAMRASASLAAALFSRGRLVDAIAACNVGMATASEVKAAPATAAIFRVLALANGFYGDVAAIGRAYDKLMGLMKQPLTESLETTRIFSAARCYFYSKDYERAGDFLEQARERLNRRPDVYTVEIPLLSVAQALVMGRLEAAREYERLGTPLNEVRERPVVIACRQLMRGLITHAEGDSKNARDLLTQLGQESALTECHPTAAMSAAWLHAEAGDFSQALDLINAWQPFSSEALSGLLLNARIQYGLGNASEALDWFERAEVRAAGSLHPFHEACGEIYRRVEAGGQQETLPLIVALPILW